MITALWAITPEVISPWITLDQWRIISIVPKRSSRQNFCLTSDVINGIFTPSQSSTSGQPSLSMSCALRFAIFQDKDCVYICNQRKFSSLIRHLHIRNRDARCSDDTCRYFCHITQKIIVTPKTHDWLRHATDPSA